MRIFATGQITVPYTLGQSVNVKADTVDRFTGAITDMAISHATTIDGNPPMTIIDVTAVGLLANLSRFYYDTTRPEEDLQARVDAILTATGLTYSAQADPGYLLLEVLAADAVLEDARTQLDVLNDWTGGTLYDKPDGTVVLSPTHGAATTMPRRRGMTCPSIGTTRLRIGSANTRRAQQHRPR